MKFKVDRQEFHKALAIVESIIPTREIRSIISNVLIETDKDKIVLTATDMEMGIKTSLSVIEGTKGKITLPAKKLSQSIREIQGSQILLESDADNRVTIQDSSGSSNVKFTLMGASTDEYPVIPTLSDDKFINFPVETVQQMIRKTSYSIAEEDSRYVFNGLYITNIGNTVAFVATDGRRLAKIERKFPDVLPFKDGIIMPNKAVREIYKLLDAAESGGIYLDDKERRVYFRLGRVDLICKLIDGQFPDYKQVIPAKQTNILNVERGLIEKSIRQVSVMAPDPTRQVRIHFASPEITISAETQDVGKAEDSFKSNYTGEETTIAFNSNFLLDVVKVIMTDEISVGFSSASSPVTLQDPSDNDFIAVIMPMKI